ncbi:preprotein translocase subunit SecE [Verrucomicrobiota bacterium]
MSKVAEVYNRIRGFFAEVHAEMKKCAWPTWGELRGSTIVVVVSVVLLSAYIGCCDLVLNWSVFDGLLNIAK